MFTKFSIEINIQIGQWLGRVEVDRAKEMSKLARLNRDNTRLWHPLYQTCNVAFYSFMKSHLKSPLSWDKLVLYVHGLSDKELTAFVRKLFQVLPLLQLDSFSMEDMLLFLKTKKNHFVKLLVQCIDEEWCMKNLVCWRKHPWTNSIQEALYCQRYNDVSMIHDAFPRSFRDVENIHPLLKLYPLGTRFFENIRYLQWKAKEGLETDKNGGGHRDQNKFFYYMALNFLQLHYVDVEYLKKLVGEKIDISSLWKFQEIVPADQFNTVDYQVLATYLELNPELLNTTVISHSLKSDRSTRHITKIDEIMTSCFEDGFACEAVIDATLLLLSLGASPGKNTIRFIQYDLVRWELSNHYCYKTKHKGKVLKLLEYVKCFILKEKYVALLDRMVADILRARH
jgi:hypothetical protein